jgi:hypothetical protein
MSNGAADALNRKDIAELASQMRDTPLAQVRPDSRMLETERGSSHLSGVAS